MRYTQQWHEIFYTSDVYLCLMTVELLLKWYTLPLQCIQPRSGFIISSVIPIVTLYFNMNLYPCIPSVESMTETCPTSVCGGLPHYLGYCVFCLSVCHRQ